MVKRLRGMVLLWLFVASFGVSAVEIVAAEFGVFDVSDPKSGWPTAPGRCSC